jgi:hypothetical protein
MAANPRTAIVSGKTITRQLANEFRAAEQLLTEGLDRLVGQFKEAAPAFVSDYFSARTVVNKCATHESPVTNVTSITQAPGENAAQAA